jgi:membrane-associated phospholipid phosphatase
MNIENIVDHIAYKGPRIITIITALQLMNQLPYMMSFIIFGFINIKLNEFLKICFREPRPEKINLVKESQKYSIVTLFHNKSGSSQVSSAHIYGMPSGHAQTGAYALGFLWFVKRMNPVFLLSCFLYVMTLIQRWTTKRHTIMQLFVGFFVGFGFSGLTYYGTKQFLYSKNNNLIDMTDFIFKHNYTSYSIVDSLSG